MSEILKFKAGAKELSAALETVERATERRTTIPILSCVDLCAEGGRLFARGTDLTVALSVPIEAEVESNGRACVRIAPLLAMVRTLDGQVEVSGRADHHVNLKGAGCKTKLLGLDPAQYPSVFTAVDPRLQTSGDTLRTLIDRCAFSAMQKEESARFSLSFVKLMAASGTWEMVSTDGHRMSYACVKHEPWGELQIAYFLSLRSLPLIASLVPEGGNVNIGESAEWIGFDAGGTYLRVKKATVTFPNWRAVLPPAARATAQITAGALEKVVRRTNIITDEKHLCVVTFIPASEGQPSGIKIDAESVGVGSISDFIECPVTGEGVTAGYNSEYLLEFLTKAVGEVSFKVVDQAVPLLAEVEGWKHVLMPMRLLRPAAAMAAAVQA